MDHKAVKDALDKAIAIVAGEEYKRLSHGLSLHEKANRVEGALKELEKLQYGKIPDYSDKWVALFYLTWYQPSHINLAYSIIKESGEPLNDRLHIVDFGCGALAMQFGVALSMSEAIEEGQSFSKLRIDSIDTSKPMIDIGKKVGSNSNRKSYGLPVPQTSAGHVKS